MGQVAGEPVEHRVDAVGAVHRQPPQHGPPDQHGARTHRQRTQHVGAGPDAAVDVDLGAPGDGRDDLGQAARGRHGPVQLPTAVVGDDETGRPRRHGRLRVVGAKHALDHDGQSPVPT